MALLKKHQIIKGREPMTLRDKLKQDLKRNRWTLRDVCKEANVYQSTFSLILKGERTPTYERAVILAKISTEKTGVAYHPLQFIYNKVDVK